MMHLYKIVCIICLFHPCYLVFTVPDDIAVSLEELAADGTDRYYENDWTGTINFFEKALINFRMRQYLHSDCQIKCKNQTMSDQMQLNFTGFSDLQYIADLLAQSNCIKLCKEEHPYRVVGIDFPDKKTLDDFERRKPYNYLQYAYFQTNKLKRASQAAQTYYNANLDDIQARDNLEIYRNEDGVDDSFFEDLEAPKFHLTFAEAVEAYEAKQYNNAASKFETVLAEYFKRFEECQAGCFKAVEQVNFYRFYKATAAHLLDVLDCSMECENRLSPISFGKKMENFVALCFSYLQFCYYSTDNLTMAVPAAASVLLLQPDDEQGRKNMLYYEKQAERLSRDHYQGRQDAIEYAATLKLIKNLLEKKRLILGEPNQDDVTDDVPDHVSSPMDSLVSEIAAKLDEKLKVDLAGRL